MHLLEACDLYKSYGGRPAVHGLNLNVQPGEIVGLLGPNGAGKTTTMHMLAGLLQPDSGQVRFMGQPLADADHRARGALGMVPQNLAVYPELTGLENLRFFGKLYGLRGQELGRAVDKTLELCHLTEEAERPVSTYSQGMKRKLNFGLGVLHEPRLLILDEPTVGIDVESRQRILQSIGGLASRGVGVLFASHYLREVENLFDRVAILKRGRMAAWAETAHLMKEHPGWVELVLQGPKQPLLERLAGVAEVRANADQQTSILIRRPANDGVDSVAALRKVLEILDEPEFHLASLRAQEPSLEQIYFEITAPGEP